MTSNPTGFKITDVAAGWNRADFDDVFVRKDCFLEGGLWIWGSNIVGAIGNNTTISQSSPVQTISGGTNWKSVSTGEFHTAAVKTDGTLWLWGYNNSGRLGNNTVTNTSSPVQTISGGANWRLVGLGRTHSAAIKTDGTLWLWGYGGSGQLGNNELAFMPKSSPIQTISGGSNWLTLSSGWSHVTAIKTDGTLWLWGSNAAGELGNNTVTNTCSPVQTISGGNNWRTVSANLSHTAAIKTDGSLWLWGCNYLGRLGNSSITDRSSPVQTISGGNNWRSVGAGRFHTAAIKTDGTLWIWGSGSHGVLGVNAIIQQSSPVQTISGGTNWRSVSAGSEGTAATKTDGTLWMWGRGAVGQFGNNAIISQSSPVQTISGGTNWRNISANFCHTAAIREDCW